MSGQLEPKVEVAKDPNYRTILVNGLFGGHRPGFFEAIVYTDEMVAEDALATLRGDPSKVRIRRTLQCRLLMDPVQAKSIAKWLTGHIAEYERTFGKIPTPEEAQHRQEKGMSV
ncbi:MAG: hypothetical protein QW220_06050 [Candidatus Bathyarchaeia archaeon]